MRTFEFSDAKSHKFWSIDLSGTSFTVTYGKIGTAGQTQTKSFPTPEKAQAEADKLVREKTGKGYVEKTAKPASSNAEVLENAIIANPHDVAAWSAYADMLLEQGDPRGEFMRVQLALEDEKLGKAERDKLKKQEAALLKKHQKEWLGEIAEDTVERKPTKWPIPAAIFEFRRGWLHTIFYPKLTVNAVRRLNRSSQAKLLQRLFIEDTANEAPIGTADEYADDFYAPGKDVPADVDEFEGPSFHVLAKCPHLGSVRTLWMSEMLNGKLGEPSLEPSCHIPGEFAYHFIKQMPNVEELRLHAHDVDMKKIFAMPLPELRHLEVYHSKDYACDKLAANKSLAKLETIKLYAKAIDICDDDPKPYLRLKQLRDICNSPNLPSLKHLMIGLTDFGDKGIAEIIKSGMLKRLKVLDLQAGCITDEGAKLLANCPDLKNLELLNLSKNAIGSDGVKLLKATKVNVNLAQQHNEGDPKQGEDEWAEYFFTEGDIE